MPGAWPPFAAAMGSDTWQALQTSDGPAAPARVAAAATTASESAAQTLRIRDRRDMLAPRRVQAAGVPGGEVFSHYSEFHSRAFRASGSCVGACAIESRPVFCSTDTSLISPPGRTKRRFVHGIEGETVGLPLLRRVCPARDRRADPGSVGRGAA